MRITMIVLLSIVVLAGVLLGGGMCWSLTAGPKAEDVTKASQLITEMKAISKGNEPGLVMLEKGMRGLRVLQIGGAALALLDIALLVLVIKRNGRAIMITGAATVALSAVAFFLGAPKEIDDGAYLVANCIAVLALAAAVFALAADRFGRPAAAVAGAPVAMR